MNKSRKVTLLYQMARGQRVSVSSDEAKELKKYKISYNEGTLATKKNIADYITAVDNGSRSSFYDWCIKNRRADRRYKGNSAEELESYDSAGTISAIMIGWLTWGMALYWMLHGTMPVNQCIIAGMVVSVILYKVARQWAGFTIFLLPIILTVVFGT
jgi:hypothetical protein